MERLRAHLCTESVGRRAERCGARARIALIILLMAATAGCGDGGAAATGELAQCLPSGMTPSSRYGCSDTYRIAHVGLREDLYYGNVAGQPPPADHLPEMTWDLNLRDVAADHAVRCRFEPNETRTEDYQALGGTADSIGENLFFTPALGAPVQIGPAVVEAWGSSSADYDYATNTCAPGADCGTYTQIVWANTTELGCAAAKCPELVTPAGTEQNVWFVVCNYAPAGNVPGEWPY